MFHLKKIFKKIGPGVITGASDDDPSGIATYSQTGARFGYQMLWLALVSTPLMMAVQEMSARLGMVTGRGLAGILKKHTSAKVVFVLASLLFLVNTINIGADLGAMAEASRLVLNGPGWLYLILFTAAIVLLEIFVSYRKYVNVLRWLTFVLFAYVAAAFFVQQNWWEIITSTIIPSFSLNKEMWLMIVAVLGTTISPYCFFWEASEEVEDEIAEGRTTIKKRTGATKKEIRSMREETVVGMSYSNIVMFFIIITTAATLHRAGITSIGNASQAAEALRPLAGNLTFMLFTVGIIGTGLLAIPILAGSASYAIAEVFGWKEGLSKQYRQAHAFYLAIAASVILGLIVNVIGIPPMQFLIYAAVLNGLLAPVIIWFILRLSDRRDVVGVHTSTPWVRFFGWFAFCVMSLSACILVYQSLFVV
ncbi:MAG: Nramp family divalent metal transporter [Candidatus Kerfeldbacteria bacterium]